MEGAELITRSYELRLLRCSVPSLSDADIPRAGSPSCPPHNRRIHLLIDGALTSIESGRYVEALSSEAAQLAFQRLPGSLFSGDSVEAADFYAELEFVVETFLAENGVDGAVLIISIAVASLLAFVQCNMTGPVIELPFVPLPWKVIESGASWEAWARNELMSAGSDLIGKFSSLQFIVFAKVLLTKAKDVFFRENAPNLGELRSISWWLYRSLLLQQRMLDDRCSSLLDLLQVYACESLNHFGDVEKVTSFWGGLLNNGEALTIVSLLHLEAGLMEHTFGRVDSAREHFKSAELASGFEISLTGALGFRTIHQVEPKALMVLRANLNSSSSGTALSNLQNSSEKGSTVEEGSEQNESEKSEVSDVLMTPRLVDNGEKDTNDACDTLNCHADNMVLQAAQQLVVLAQCLLIERSARQDDIQRWKMAPYIEAVDSQQSSYFIIKCFCNILRIRWESSRSRTKERSLLMMDKLVHYYVQSHIQINEYRDCVVLPSASKTHGRHISTCIKILDMTGLKLSALSQIKVVKPLLQERTRKKVQVLSGCGQDELLKIMDYDSLPHFCRKQGSGSSKHLSEACKNCFSYDHPFHQQLYDYIKKQASLLEPAAPLTQRSFHVNLPETEGSVEEVDQTIESEVHKLEISESSYGSASSED